MRSGKVETFEDLIAWQKARELTMATYKRTNIATTIRIGIVGN